MAGIAALMTRKKREKREMELKSQLHSEESFSEVVAGNLPKKGPNDTIKKLLAGKELMRQKSKSMDAHSQEYYDDDGAFKNNSGQAYSSIYIGLVLICIGLVITFVGLGEKGFKTLELKMIGPVLCLVGLSCIVYKVLQCTFPKFFENPSCFNSKFNRVILNVFKQGNKLADSDHSNLMEKGTQNGHLGHSKKASPPTLSPRVTLHSSKKALRPRSTIPNYIEDSSDEDDFNPHRNRPQSNRYHSEDDVQFQPSAEVEKFTAPDEPEPEPQSTRHYAKKIEVLLNPKTLML